MAKEAVIVDENSTSLEIAGLQGEPITYDSLATGLMVSSNSCILDEDDESGVIDPSFLMHDAEFAALTTGVFKPLPSRFINVYKVHIAIDKLDNEIEVLSSHTKHILYWERESRKPYLCFHCWQISTVSIQQLQQIFASSMAMPWPSSMTRSMRLSLLPRDFKLHS